MIYLPQRAKPYARMHRTSGDYVDSVIADYEQIVPYLPVNVRSIIDIGCGLGGIDVLLSRHYPGVEIHLLDGTGSTERQSGYRESMSPFNDLSITKEVMSANNVTNYVIHEIGDHIDIAADLCISLLSCGWHYPLSVYAELMGKSKTIIIDKRKRDPGLPRSKLTIGLHGDKGSRVIYGLG